MAGLKDYKYKVIKKFFTPEEIILFKSYCKNKLFENTWVTDDQCPFTPIWSNDPLMNALLESKLNLVESHCGLKLFKTYSYWRYYAFGSILKPHRDRPSCEVSITACIHKTAMWPLVIDDKQYDLEEGDALLYLGCEISHSRYDYFNGDGLAQVFLHYVDQEGPFTHHKNDDYLKRTKSAYSEKDQEICDGFRKNS